MTPNQVDPNWWTAATFEGQPLTDALARRDIGLVLRFLRSRGFSRSRLAAITGISETRIRAIASGSQEVGRYDVLERVAEGLFIRRDLMGLSYAPPRPETHLPTVGEPILAEPVSEPAVLLDFADGDPAALWMSQDAADLIGDFTRRDLSLDRRGAVRSIAGFMFGGALLEPLERWLSDEPQHNPKGRRGLNFGVEEVEQIEAAAQLFRSWDDRFGGGLRRKAVVGQLSEVADMLRDAPSSPLTSRLYAAMSQLAGTAASMSWDSGYSGLAQQYYVLAFKSARAAGDRAYGANILAGMARQLLYLDNSSDALELVRLAQEWAHGYLPAAVKSMLHTREAWAYARQGRLAAFRRATGKAHETLASARPGDDQPFWIAYFNQAELAGVTGGRLLELAHQNHALAGESAEEIETAIRLRSGQHLRSSALDRIGIAEARLIQREVDEACRLGHLAADAAERTPSDRVKVKLAEFYRYTTPHVKVPAVAELRQRLTGILVAV